MQSRRWSAAMALVVALGPTVVSATEPDPTTPRSAASELLCPARTVGPNEADELMMEEHEFTIERALASAKFLNTEFARRIWGPDRVTDFGASSENYISYANGLRFIEGSLLRQDALRLRLEVRLREATRSSPEEVVRSRRAFEGARARFCEFVSASDYVD